MVLLVLLTGFYAFQTRRSVKAMEDSLEESRHARKASMMPQFVLQLSWRYAVVATPDDALAGVRITNVGGGPAKQVEFTIVYHPPERAHQSEQRRRYFFNAFTPGQRVWDHARSSDGDRVTVRQLPQVYEKVTVSGTYIDALDIQQTFEGQVDNLERYVDQLEEGFDVEDSSRSGEARLSILALRDLGHAVYHLCDHMEALMVGDDEEGDDEGPPMPPSRGAMG